jgi:hypothetical protein
MGIKPSLPLIKNGSRRKISFGLVAKMKKMKKEVVF